jgi:hypothetical protein
MPTVISDGLEHSGLPAVSKRSYSELLEHAFEPEASFWIKNGIPYVLWGDWDYAEDWGGPQMREVHPFVPVTHGKEIGEGEFRLLVRRLHGLDRISSRRH